MDDQDFDDFFHEEDMLLDSSQESLTTAGANFQFGNDDDDQDMDNLLSTPGISAHSQGQIDIRGDQKQHGLQIKIDCGDALQKATLSSSRLRLCSNELQIG